MKPLYSQPIPSKRTGPLYNAFSYPTKIDPEAIAVFIASHTQPGATVLDVFGGSGTTGIAARMCDQPTARMKELAADIGIEVEWGPRHAVIYELSTLGTFITEVLTNPPDPNNFVDATDRILDLADQEIGSYYAAIDPDGGMGRIRYAIWTELLETTCCESSIPLYDATVLLNPAQFCSSFSCPNCGESVVVSSCNRIMEEALDPYTNEKVVRRKRILAKIYGKTDKTNWSRRSTRDDISRFETIPLASDWFPTNKIFWGDLYRSGYHSGITRFHHLYTARNLAVFSKLWSLVRDEPPSVRDALKLLLLSYNSSHSTLQTRVVAKKNQKDLVVTGAQSGVLYVSGLPVEKNILSGIRRKANTLAAAFRLSYGSRSKVRAVCGSSTTLSTLDDGSIDYVFTDPPFGDYIPYAEINQVNEAWLSKLTDRTFETIVSSAQDKTTSDYTELLSMVFSEVSRVVKENALVTVIFHASKPAIWEAVAGSFRANGFGILDTSVLDKQQTSFKQVVSSGGTRGDAIFLLKAHQHTSTSTPNGPSTEQVILELIEAAQDDSLELDPKRLWSRFVAQCIQQDAAIDLSASDFYAKLESMNFSAQNKAT
jgi:DNA modification methylase